LAEDNYYYPIEGDLDTVDNMVDKIAKWLGYEGSIEYNIHGRDHHSAALKRLKEAK